MLLSDFDYGLPKHLIAQKPAEPRDSSKLMVLHNEQIEHKTFRDLVGYLNKGDVLVLNDSKVLPARLFGKKETGGKVEILLINKGAGNKWECLIKGKNIRKNTRLILGEGSLEGIIGQRIEGGRYEVEFLSENNIENTIQEIGKMPTPPYIKELLEKPERYQTVYAKEKGSIAAPTAGLHFTGSLLDKLRKEGIEIVSITLHVSIGTFLPVKNHDITKYRMEPEYFKVGAKAAKKINLAKNNGNKVFAVGTTTVKAIESTCNDSGEILEMEGESDLFIYPGYEFKTNLNGLLTNFHLPKSTLLMLVSAFAGREKIIRAYETAIEHSYRFYSFGDAMLILKG
jgi:S-adenosylmethionine:tRNA ribosyltransferase-isomerase